jgi:hypothetical protein
MKLFKLIAILSFILLLMECSDDDDIVFNEELVFNNSYEIKIPPFRYLSIQGDSVYVRGDLSFDSDIIDTVPPTPALLWEKVESDIICAAIFKNSINADNHSIKNDASDIVWIWHSGFAEGENGLVQFENGIKEIDPDNPDSTAEPEPLVKGKVYYWAVWAWDNSGLKIIFSSRELRFVVN